MTEEVKQKIKIDDVEYVFEELSEKAQHFVRHVTDLEAQVTEAQQAFNAARMRFEQAQVARNAFFGMLKAELEQKAE